MAARSDGSEERQEQEKGNKEQPRVEVEENPFETLRVAEEVT